MAPSTPGGYDESVRERSHTEPARAAAAFDRVRTAALSPLALTVLSAAIVVLRYERTQLGIGPQYDFIGLNLFLAWVPLALAYGISLSARRPARWFALAGLGVLWILFLPNAPYLVTDLVHLHHPGGFRVVLEVALFGSVAIAGVLLGVASVQPVHRLAAERLGPLAAGAFPPVIALAVAFGVYLGRVQRWNSWELFETPGSLLHATWTVLGHPADHPRAVGGIALFTLAFLAAYLALTTERGSFGAPQHHA